MIQQGEESQVESNPTIFRAQGHYIQFSDPNATNKIEESDCNLSLTRDSLTIDSKTGQHYEFAYRDMTKVIGENYAIRLAVGAEISLALQALGSAYQAFLETLYTAKNDQFAQDLLIAEGKPSFLTKGKMEVLEPDEAGQLQQITSNGEIRVYKTQLVVFPIDSEPHCIRFADVRSSKFENYRALFEAASTTWNENGERKLFTKKIALSQLGQNFDPLQRYFTSNSSQVLQDTTTLIKESYPGISSINLLKLSRMLLDGIPTQVANLNAIDPNFFRAIEFQIAESKEDLVKCLEFLYSVGKKDQAYLGAKKLVTNYLYIMIPVNDEEIIALETNEEGHATYFFRKPIGELSGSETLALALREINYRREPIYLTDDDLLKPQYGKYKFSVDRIPALRFLRKHYIGRAIHSDFDTWKSQASNLLSGIPQDTEQVGRASSTAATITPGATTMMSTTPHKTTDTIVEQQNKTLNLVKAPEQFMVERVLSVRNMEGVEEGRVKMWLRDDEMDNDVYVKLSGNDVAQLGAFPGSKVKLSIQKV